MDENQQACLSLLREGDRDRYLCALLTPDGARGSVAALYAFNLEIARIRDLVTEPMMGEVRMQWWKDLIIGEAHGDATGHPVAAALMQAVDDGRLPRQILVDLIEARQFDLYDDPMPDRNTFEGYAGETASAVIPVGGADPRCRQKCCRPPPRPAMRAWRNWSPGCCCCCGPPCPEGQVYVPGEILAAAGLDRDAFLAGRDAAALERALSAFVSLGREHLSLARSEAVAPACFAAFSPRGNRINGVRPCRDIGAFDVRTASSDSAMAPSDPLLECGAQGPVLIGLHRGNSIAIVVGQICCWRIRSAREHRILAIGPHGFGRCRYLRLLEVDALSRG